MIQLMGWVVAIVGLAALGHLISQLAIATWDVMIAGFRGAFGLMVLPALMIIVAIMFFHRRKVNYDTSESWDVVYRFLVITMQLALCILLIMVGTAIITGFQSGEYVLCFQDPTTPGREVLMKDEFGKPFCMKDWRG